MHLYILLLWRFKLKLLAEVDLTVVYDLTPFVGISQVEYRPCMGSLWPAGQIQPAESCNLAREEFLMSSLVN